LDTGAHQVEQFAHGGGTLIDETLGQSNAPHIVFMHGWGGTRDSLRGIAALFEPTHRVHLLDLPGFGDAPPPPADWDTIKYTDLIQYFVLDHLAGPVVLVGHSFGGRIAVRLAARRLPQIDRIVLMGVPGLPRSSYSWVSIRRRAIGWLRTVLRAARPLTGPRLIEWHTQRFGSKDYLAAGALRPVLVRVVNEDLTESVKTIACRTLLLWGSDDRETPVDIAEQYAKLLEGRATLHVLPHKDHYLFSGTGAHLCAFKIRSWLQADAGT
jgi:pimeloyl-ACP methyl ester carboxylesterase